jgi:hypothetical protein
MKRLLYEAGLGKKALATWRSQTQRTSMLQNKATAIAGGEAGVRAVIRGIRASRAARGLNPTTNRPPRRIKGTLTVAKPVPMKGKGTLHKRVMGLPAEKARRAQTQGMNRGNMRAPAGGSVNAQIRGLVKTTKPSAPQGRTYRTGGR